MDEVKAQLDRIEAKLDWLIEALTEEEEQPLRTLDGEIAGFARDENTPL